MSIMSSDLKVSAASKDVLIMVDDNAEMRTLFNEILADSGLTVQTFPTVREAQIYLINPERRDKVCGIVSDLMMCPMDGLEFLSYVKKNPDLLHIDFFLLTGANVSVFKPLIMPFRISGIIEKPFNASKVRALLSTLLPKVSKTTELKKVAA